MNAARPIMLTEFAPKRLPVDELSHEAGEILWQTYSRQVAVDFPSPKTGGHWELTAQGWVGHIPLTPEISLALHPKTPLSNVFRMLEYAYRLKSFRMLDGLFACQSLEEFYQSLAHVLARRVLDRSRRGLYRAYYAETERLPYVRGRLDVQPLVQKPWLVDVTCHYDEHSADIEDNRILAWTLCQIARSGLCLNASLHAVRRAYRGLQGFVTLQPCPAQLCVARPYNRLNEDYRLLHGLCRFFLEHSGPTYLSGDHLMLPFLVDMARLYELFVAEWLRVHLPAHFLIKAQENVPLGTNAPLSFDIDLVLYDSATGTALCVLDTKYKTASTPAPSDIGQVVAYATVKECREAILIYPMRLNEPEDVPVGNVRVRSLSFPLDGDLEQAGQVFKDRLISMVGHS